MLTFAFAMLLTLAPQQASSLADARCAEGDYDHDIFKGVGACVLVYQDMRFEADWITYDKSTGNVSAGDHVHFERGSERFDGSHLEMNARTKAGTISDATGTVEPGFHVKAKVALRFEDESWEFHNTSITACESLRPCWTIVLARSWYRPGEWVRGKNMVFHFHGVPGFYLPYFAAPSEKKDRSTGFLIPSISNSSTKGHGYREQFFYAINGSADASIVGEYFSMRGPTAEVSFRAKPTSSGWISVNSFFAKDRLKQGGNSLRVIAFTDWGKYSRAVVDLDTASSETFRQVWGASFNVIASPINRSSGFVSTNRPNSSINVVASSSEFLQTEPSTLLRKLPAVEFSTPSRELSSTVPAYFKLEGGFSGASRKDSVIASPVYGERFDFHPTVLMPVLRLNAFELSQEAGVRETAYSDSLEHGLQQRSLNRFTLEYSARFAGPELYRTFGKWRHSIRPTLDYRFVTGADRFRNTVITDDVDLAADTSEVEYGVTNRITGSRDLLIWRVAQVAYFNPTFGGAILTGHRNVFSPLLGLTGFSFADRPRHVSPIVSTFGLAPKQGYALSVELDYDTQLRKMRSTGVVTTVQKGKWNSSLLYGFIGATSLQASSNQAHGSLSYGGARGLSVSTTVSYDVQTRFFQGATTALGYNAECYGLNLVYSVVNLGARQEHKWYFALSLKNIGAFGNMTRPDRVF